ncbi:MAG: hypothetical protein ACOH2F_14045 [Cellulomonas sp.]
MKVDTFDLGTSDRWASWTPGDGVAGAEGAAALLGSTPPAQARVREAIEVFDRRMPLDRAMCLMGALWVPDASSGEPWAFLLVDLLVSTDPGDPVTAEDYLFMTSKAPKQRGLKVFDYSAAAATVAAGPAVIQVEVSATKKERDVTSTVVWTVFPPGSHEAVRLSFSSPAPAVSEAFSEETSAVAHGLSVTLVPGS